MIEAKGLTKKYGNFRALDKVSFEVRKGEVVGFLGPNGAGKSTTMRILTCYLSASGGTAKVHGHDVFDAPLEVRNKIGYLPQRATMYGEMSVWDYLQFVSELRSIPSSNFRKRMKDVVEVCGLSRVLGKLVEDGFINQRPDPADRRRKQLTLSDKGKTLEHDLTATQLARFARAYREAGDEAVEGFRRVLTRIIDPEDRARVRPAAVRRA